MKRDIVILYSESSDPVVDALKSDDRVNLIHVDQLFEFIRPGSWPKMIESDFPDDVYELFLDARVINRIFSFRGTRLGELIASLGLHELWAHRSLASLLRLASVLAHDTGTKGISSSLLPLNTQWFLIKRAQSAAQVPVFVYGFGQTIPDLHKFHDPMRKSVWSLFDWKIEAHLPPHEENWHHFFVERPVGTPVICYYAGDQLELSFPRGETIEVNLDVYKEIAHTACNQFKSYFGEFLTYHDQGMTTFYAFSPYLLSVRSEARFAGLIASGIDRLVGNAVGENQGECELAVS
jgi:hypothetical protein